MYKAVQMDDGSICLVHHGIQGQRWGVRRYQNEDGSLTPAGRLRYLIDGKEYRSESGLLKNATSKQYQRSKELDKAITERRNSESTGKKFVKAYLFDSSSRLTYDMARATGSGRFGSFMRSVFDINLASMVGGMAGSIIGNRVGGALASNMPTNFGKLAVKGAMTGLGYLAGQGVSKAMAPTELSLQQRSLRRQTMTGRRKIDKG